MRRYLTIAMMLVIGIGIYTSWNRTIGDDRETSWFKSTTVDFGIVVSDVEKSVAFYRDVLGLKETSTFDVSSEIATDAGLTKGESLSVHVMQLGNAATATKVKLMQIEGSTPAKQDTSYINSTLGMSYMTLHVTDVSKVLKNAEKHGVKAIAKGPADISRGSGNKMVLAIVRDPDGNLVELVGPLN
ncbi:Glyoxalase-like domain protein [Polystyrenella longa]|uniref:Glyoxalase-like domain protein n=1 Tax=Polystyrenella longa TaxID=2528007 RepID=A0A518CJA5_9PLAN|nr:VOC family protein [Polystyrenella longa]QDU79308.1 Glyoxalase-like domain protein [Polystyrenella longa]